MTYKLAPHVTAEMLEKEKLQKTESPFVYGLTNFTYTMPILSPNMTCTLIVINFENKSVDEWPFAKYDNPVRWQVEHNAEVKRIYERKIQDLIEKGYVIANE